MSDWKPDAPRDKIDEEPKSVLLSLYSQKKKRMNEPVDISSVKLSSLPNF